MLEAMRRVHIIKTLGIDARKILRVAIAKIPARGGRRDHIAAVADVEPLALTVLVEKSFARPPRMRSRCFAFVVLINFGGLFLERYLRLRLRNDENVVERTATQKYIAVAHRNIFVVESVLDEQTAQSEIRADDVNAVVNGGQIQIHVADFLEINVFIDGTGVMMKVILQVPVVNVDFRLDAGLKSNTLDERHKIFGIVAVKDDTLHNFSSDQPTGSSRIFLSAE